MGERLPKKNKEYNPLDDTRQLIGSVLSPTSQEEHEEPPQPEALTTSVGPRPAILKEAERVPQPQAAPKKEEMVICKFKVPKTDYLEFKRIMQKLEIELGCNLDISNIGRAWLTRFITAEQELADAAVKQEKLKTPNTRNPLEIAEIDHAMATIQSVAFRRAKPIR